MLENKITSLLLIAKVEKNKKRAFNSHEADREAPNRDQSSLKRDWSPDPLEEIVVFRPVEAASTEQHVKNL